MAKITLEICKLKKKSEAFHYMDEDLMKYLIVSEIRPRLEYAPAVWYLQKKMIWGIKRNQA